MLTGERLAELLSVIAEAPDFATAAGFVLEQLAGAAGVSRACFFGLDPARHMLSLAALHGFTLPSAPVALSLEELHHPLVVAALSLCPVIDDDGAPSRLPVPFQRCTAVPFPQPHFRGSPANSGR